MKYRIEPANGFAVCIATHVVKRNGKIVFRGDAEDCSRWVQGAINDERDFAMEGR